MQVWSVVNDVTLKEYYEIVNGSPPSIRILPHRCRFVYRNAFLLMKLSNQFQCDPSSNCLTINVWKNIMINQFSFLTVLLLFVYISFYTSSVVFWHVIFWQYLFKTIICSSVYFSSLQGLTTVKIISNTNLLISAKLSSRFTPNKYL